MYKKDSGVNIPILIAFVLFCLTMFSMHLLGGLMAKFAYEDTLSDEATIAVMAMDTSYTANNIYAAPGEVREFAITLTNEDENGICEVAQEYSLTVQSLSFNIPITYELYKVDNSSQVKVDEITGQFDAGVKQSATYKVQVKWPEAPQPAEMAFEIDALKFEIKSNQID